MAGSSSSGRYQKNPIERILDAQLHLKMAREGPVGKCEQRIHRAERELEAFDV